MDVREEGQSKRDDGGVLHCVEEHLKSFVSDLGLYVLATATCGNRPRSIVLRCHTYSMARLILRPIIAVRQHIFSQTDVDGPETPFS
jgi:hypothetical protein